MDFKGGGGVGKFPYAHNWEGGTKHGGRRGGGGGKCAKNVGLWHKLVFLHITTLAVQNAIRFKIVHTKCISA